MSSGKTSAVRANKEKKVFQCYTDYAFDSSVGNFRFTALFLEGMTWQEWLNSDYYVTWLASQSGKTYQFYVKSIYMYIGDGDSGTRLKYNGVQVKPNDLMHAGEYQN